VTSHPCDALPYAITCDCGYTFATKALSAFGCHYGNHRNGFNTLFVDGDLAE
jgi:prepilin-type processing-associated H-X9-DG protein